MNMTDKELQLIEDCATNISTVPAGAVFRLIIEVRRLICEAEQIRSAFGYHPETSHEQIMELIEEVRREARGSADAYAKGMSAGIDKSVALLTELTKDSDVVLTKAIHKSREALLQHDLRYRQSI